MPYDKRLRSTLRPELRTRNLGTVEIDTPPHLAMPDHPWMQTEQVDPARKAAYRATRRKVGVDREFESVDVHGIDHVPREGER